MSIDDRARPAWLPAPPVDPPTVVLPRVSPAQPLAGPPRRSWPGGLMVAVGTAAVLFGVVLIVALSSLMSSRSFAVSGTFDLGASCATAYTGYDDIHPGTAVTVRDAAGTIVATGALSGGTGGYAACHYTFMIDDVPTGSAFSQVEVSHRGSVNYTAEQITTSGAQITLG